MQLYTFFFIYWTIIFNILPNYIKQLNTKKKRLCTISRNQERVIRIHF